MKMNLKNLKNQADFKLMFENHKIKNTELFQNYKLNEDMDFSNRTGFSESLVGRIINKSFSFVASTVEVALLKKRKNELDNAYNKAVMATISKIYKGKIEKQRSINKKIKKFKFKDYIVGSLKSTVDDSIDIDGTSTEQIASMFKFDNKQLNQYKELVVLQKEIQVIENQSLLNKQIEFVASAKNDSSDGKIVVYKKSDNDEEKLNNQIATLKSLNNMIKAADLKGENIGMMAKISNKLGLQINNVKDEEKKNQLTLFKNNIDKELNSFSDEQKNISDENFKKRSNNTENKGKNDDDFEAEKKARKKIQDDFWSKVENAYKSEKITRKKYAKLMMLIHPDKLVGLSSDEINKRFEQAKKIFYSVEEKHILGLINEYEKLFEVENSLAKQGDNLPVKNGANLPAKQGETLPAKQGETLPAKQGETTPAKVQNVDDAQQDKVLNDKIAILNKKIETFIAIVTDEQKANADKIFNERIPVNKIIQIDPSDSDDVKNALEDNDYVYVGDTETYFEDYEYKKDFVLSASTYVNHEELKMVALKAQMLYNTENYKDARNDVYSRVNFTTTQPDKKKLENKWLIMVSSVKAKYMKYFSDTGIFPEDLDPIALMNSDVTFRKNYDEYKNVKIKKKDSSPITKDIQKTFKFSVDTNKEYMIYFVDDGVKKQGLIYRRIVNNDKFIYKLLSIVDWESLIQEINDDVSDNEITSLLSKHTKSGADIDDFLIKDFKIPTLHFNKKLSKLSNKKNTIFIVGKNINDYKMKNKTNYDEITLDHMNSSDYKNNIVISDLFSFEGDNNNTLWKQYLYDAHADKKYDDLFALLETLNTKTKNKTT